MEPGDILIIISSIILIVIPLIIDNCLNKKQSVLLEKERISNNYKLQLNRSHNAQKEYDLLKVIIYTNSNNNISNEVNSIINDNTKERLREAARCIITDDVDIDKYTIELEKMTEEEIFQSIEKNFKIHVSKQDELNDHIILLKKEICRWSKRKIILIIACALFNGIAISIDSHTNYSNDKKLFHEMKDMMEAINTAGNSVYRTSADNLHLDMPAEKLRK